MVLTRGYAHTHLYADLLKRNDAIFNHVYKHLDDNDKPDIIIFHQGNINYDHQQYIQQSTPHLPLNWVSVHEEFNQNLVKTESIWCKETHLSRCSSIGYKHMCRFWFGTFIKYVKDYDYACRIDEDCFVSNESGCLLKAINNMQDATYISAFEMNWNDDPDVVMGINDLAHSIGLSGTVQPPLPYTSFFIIDVKFYYNNNQFFTWVQEVEKAGGIYINRWGDLPLWGVVLSSGIGKLKIDKTISYLHGSHNQKVN